jgi:hypothetical protein
MEDIVGGQLLSLVIEAEGVVGVGVPGEVLVDLLPSPLTSLGIKLCRTTP